MNKEFLYIQAIVEWRLTLNPVSDMIMTCNQMQEADKYSQHSSIIWPVWLNGWPFVYKLNGCWLEFRCCHLNFRYRACFDQGVSWFCEWCDNNIQLNLYTWFCEWKFRGTSFRVNDGFKRDYLQSISSATINISCLLAQYVWSPNLIGWWLIITDFHP